MAPKVVEFVGNGPTGPHAASLSSHIGRTLRVYVSPRIKKWKEVPDSVRNTVWNIVSEEFVIPEEKKDEWFIPKVGELWKKWKHTLHRKYYRVHGNDIERKANVPRGVRQEDWDELVDYFSSAEYQLKSVSGTQNRARMKSIHRSGRKGQAQAAAELREKNGKSPDRTTVWLNTHTGKDGSSTNPHVNAVRALHELDNSLAQSDLDKDPVAIILGPDSRGHVRGMGFGASKTRMRYTAPYRATIQQQRTKQETMQEEINLFNQRLKVVEEWKNSQLHSSHNRTHSTENHEGSSSQAPSTTPTSTRPGGRCKLMWRHEVVAEGRLSETHADTGLHDIIIDDVFIYDVPLPEEDGTIGAAVGSTIQWPIRTTIFY